MLTLWINCYVGGLQWEGGFESPLMQLDYTITSEYKKLFSCSHAGLDLPADVCYHQCENLLVRKKQAEIMEVP